MSSDVFTPIGAYLALGTPGASCLLESVDHNGRISRYSFVGIDYAAQASFDVAPDLLDRMRAFVSEHRPSGPAAPLGGALVAFAYDAARAFAPLSSRPAQVPRMPAAYAAIPTTWLIFDHFTDRLTIWCARAGEHEAHQAIDACIDRLLRAQPAIAQPVRGTMPVECSLDHDAFLALAARAKQRIFDGDIYQIQLGIRFACALHGAPLDLYRALRSRNPSPYMFFVDAPFGAVLGASPEFLVRFERGTARIRPLAGTRPRGADLAEDARIGAELLADQKERAEHVMLVDLARNDLGAVSEYASVTVEELMRLERYSHVMHIVSEVSGRVRSQHDALDVFAASFPAGTVTGAPKVRSMQLIDEMEPTTRGFYAGSVGRWSYGGDFDSCISLRGVHVHDGRAYWQASAGIVADSDPESEYREVLHKTGIVRSVLGVDVP